MQRVRRHIEAVAFLTPQNVAQESVDLRVVGFDATGNVHLRNMTAAQEILSPQRFGIVRDLDVALPVVCECGRTHSSSHQRRRVKSRTSLAQIATIEVAVLQNFADLQRDCGTFGLAVEELRPACLVLTEIKYGFTGGSSNDLL